MEFKRALLASSALALFAGAQEAQAGDLYLSVFGGANFHQDASGLGTSNYNSSTLRVSTDADTGFVLGGAVGTSLSNWAKGLRAEVEVSFRRNDAGGLWTLTTSSNSVTSGTIDANISNFAMLANVWYDIDVGSKFKPYVGGGVGWARAHLDGALLSSDGSNTSATFDSTNNGFAFQVGVGFNYPVADGVSVGVGYRYFKAPSLHLDPVFGFKNAGDVTLDNESHSAMINLTIDMD